MAISPKAMTRPMGLAMPTRWVKITWIGLVCDAASSWLWIEIGLSSLKKLGFASFCRPA